MAMGIDASSIAITSYTFSFLFLWCIFQAHFQGYFQVHFQVHFQTRFFSIFSWYIHIKCKKNKKMKIKKGL